MPAWLAALPFLVTPSDLDALVHRVQACEVRTSSGRCVRGGDGGPGGPAIIKVYGPTYITPRAGDGGAGGNATGSGTRNMSTGSISAPTSSTISRCSLKIAGRMVVDGYSCSYERMTDTKFKMSSNNYTWTVDHNADRTAARGSLTGGKSASVRDLGLMTPQGACWLNTDQTVQLCGWK
jgi:hypothetical protein